MNDHDRTPNYDMFLSFLSAKPERIVMRGEAQVPRRQLRNDGDTSNKPQEKKVKQEQCVYKKRNIRKVEVTYSTVASVPLLTPANVALCNNRRYRISVAIKLLLTKICLVEGVLNSGARRYLMKEDEVNDEYLPNDKTCRTQKLCSARYHS